MRVRGLGCSGSFPGPDSPASSYLLETAWPDGQGDGVFRIVLDLGNGSLGALQRYADLCAIDAVALSHLHPDHCADLCSYYVVRKYHPDGHWPRIPVYGPYSTADRLAAAYGLPIEPGMREEFDFRSWVVGQPIRLGPYRVTTAVVNHPVSA
ncbi:MAG TPA: MBL fold metallo-hydrolase, partial [Actinopolymorphaceae bacterium]